MSDTNDNPVKSTSEDVRVKGRDIPIWRIAFTLLILAFISYLIYIYSDELILLFTSPQPSPTPGPSPSSSSVSDFPMNENSKLHIQIKNSSDRAIRVWMDDLPFCPKKLGARDFDHLAVTSEEIAELDKVKRNCGVYQTENPTRPGEGGRNKWRNDWSSFINWAIGKESVPDDLIPKFYNIKHDGTLIDLTETIIDNFYDLDPGEIFKITPPHDTNNDKYIPQMCFYQPEDKDNDKEEENHNVGGLEAHISEPDPNPVNDKTTTYQYNCGGAGLYFTHVPPDPTIYDRALLGPDAISRIEYNINGGHMYFNLSGVDGLNARYSMEVKNSLCDNGIGVTSKCNIDVDECFEETILKNKEEAIGNINNNYLAFANGNPTVKSCPSPKFYYSYDKPGEDHIENSPYDYTNHSFIGRGDITYDNISSSNPDIDGCNDVIGDSSWDDEYVRKTVIFSDAVVETKYQTHIGDPRMQRLYEKLQDNGYTGDISNLQQHAYFLQPTKVGDPFGPDKFYDQIVPTDEKSAFTNHSLAECKWGSEREKSLCHLWWGSEVNNCGNDWKKYLYESLEYGKEQDGWNDRICNQYSWAYGEMGYDYTKRKYSTGEPKSFFTSDQWENLEETGDVRDDTIRGMKDKNEFLIIYRGNPQQSYPIGRTEDGTAWNWGGDKNLESFNKPLLNCPLTSEENPEFLMNEAVYINIDVMDLMDGNYELSDSQIEICQTTLSEKPDNCGSWITRKDCANPTGESCFNNGGDFAGLNIPWTQTVCKKNGSANPCNGFNQDLFKTDYNQAYLECKAQGCDVAEGEGDNYCYIGSVAPFCSASSELDCFKTNRERHKDTRQYPFYCSNLVND